VVVTPQSQPENAAEAGGLLSIAGVSTFDARLTPPQTEGTHPAFSLTIVNTGDLPLTPVVTAFDPEDKCRFKFRNPPKLEPGQQTIIQIKASARRSSILGAAETFDFGVNVSPAVDAPISAGRGLDARFVHKPRLGFRAAFFAGFTLMLVGIVALMVAFARPAVVEAADWVGCQLDSSYRFTSDSPEIRKPSCGGPLRSDELDKWRRIPRLPRRVSIPATLDPSAITANPSHSLVFKGVVHHV
jgi:hypothetical protein